MKLSEFLGILDQHLDYKVKSGSSTGRVTIGDKVKAYLNAFILPSDEENPLDELLDDYLRKIFNGSEALPKDVASFIRSNIDSSTFEDFCNDMTYEAKEKMILEFNKHKINISIDTFERDITETFDQILYYIVNLKPSTSVRDVEFIGSGRIKIVGRTFNLPPELLPADDFSDFELPYITALLRVYSQVEKFGSITIDDLKSMHPRYETHLKFQRECYFSAESLLHQIRDIFTDGEEEFNNVKNETYMGVRSVVLRAYKDAMERVDKTMEHVVLFTYSKAYLGRSTNGLVGPSEKQGLVHMLVNDGKIEWVVDYDKDI